MRETRPSGSEGGVESHISIPTPIYSMRHLEYIKPQRGGMFRPQFFISKLGWEPRNTRNTRKQKKNTRRPFKANTERFGSPVPFAYSAYFAVSIAFSKFTRGFMILSCHDSVD